MRDLEYGRGWIFYLCAVVFAGDTCALYGGKFFGRHKLAPKISPKKTIEGAVAGLLGSCTAGLIVARFGIPGFEVKTFLMLSAFLGICGQVGDLWESALKRQAQVKDSGGLLPGQIQSEHRVGRQGPLPGDLPAAGREPSVFLAEHVFHDLQE